MSVALLRGDALDLPLADSSVDLVVTSPPYFGLRYCRLATWRTTDPRQRAKAAQCEYTPPPPQMEGQAAFHFGEETA